MAVYIDDAYIKKFGYVWCHMAADTHQELMDMADEIGIDKDWLQYKGTYREHFDVTFPKRKKAVAKGAVEVTQRELLKLMQQKDERRISENYTVD